MLRGFNFLKLVFLSTLVFTYSDASNSHIFQYHGHIGYTRCAAETQPNWQWRDIFQIVRSRENHKKGLKCNYACLIDFLSQISKLSYFNLLDLADFLMHH